MMNSKYKPILAALILFSLVLITFYPVHQFDFLNFDDNVYVTENPYVNSGLTAHNITWAFTHNYAGHWHPLTWISHQLDVTLFGLDAGKHHLVNVIIHATNTLLLFWLLIRLFSSTELALFIAALFALHPQRLESVAWITERKDVLSMFFGLASLLLYERYRITRKKIYYGFLLAMFTLGLLSKPSLMIFPALLLLIDFWPLQLFSLPLKKKAPSINQLLIEKTPLFLIALIFTIIVIFAQHDAGALKGLQGYTWQARLSSVFIGYLTYLYKTFLPFELGIFYPFVIYPPLWGIAAFLTFASLCLVIYKTEKRVLIFGWSWFVISLFPVIGFIQIGGQAMADRWSYWPHLGIAIALCGGLNTLAAKYSKYMYTGLLMLLGLSVYKTSIELPYWKNSESIFSHTLSINPQNFLAHTNLGEALGKKGQTEAASFHYREALKTHPFYTEALNNLGNLKARNGNFNEALALFQKVLSTNSGDYITRYNLGLTYYHLGQKDQAINEWQKVILQKPDYSPAQQSLEFTKRH